MELSEEIHEVRMQAYQDSCSDREAAESLGISKQAFRKWRNQQNLPPKGVKPPRFTENELLSAYHEGINDSHAATILVCCQSTFSYWRRKNGWPLKKGNNSRGIPKGFALDPEKDALREFIYHQTENDAHAARVLEMKVNTFRNWRLSRKLPAKAPRNDYSVREADFWEAWNESQTSQEASRRIGCHYGTFLRWCQNQGVKPPGQSLEGGRNKALSAKYWNAYAICLSDSEMAEFIGITALAANRWRKRLHLPNAYHVRRKFQRLVLEARKGNEVALFHVKRRFPSSWEERLCS